MPNRTTISVTEMVVCQRDRWVNSKNKTDYTNLATIFVTEMVVCNRDRWVNRNKLAMK